jgi:protein gp37
MGRNSSIEWTHHTFNPWWGCAKVSPGCAHCYAETLTRRFGGAIWGRTGERRLFNERHWSEPQRWNSKAEQSGTRCRVFCASMADVFEDRRELDRERLKLWALIERTKSLDWLLLTKRPDVALRLNPWGEQWPDNVWLGTSVENQEWADIRIPQLLALPAKTRFLSCEPLLGALNLRGYTKGKTIHWIIVGGESGYGARPMNPNWVRSLRDFAAREEIAFHFKQWGNFAPVKRLTPQQRGYTFPQGIAMILRQKALNGRTLDGKTYDGVPQ